MRRVTTSLRQVARDSHGLGLLVAAIEHELWSLYGRGGSLRASDVERHLGALAASVRGGLPPSTQPLASRAKPAPRRRKRSRAWLGKRTPGR